MPEDILDLIDYDRYPLHDLTGSSGEKLVRELQHEFDENGLIELEGFLRPEATAAIVSSAMEDERNGAYRFSGTSEVFSHVEEGAERHTGLKYTKTDIPYDKISSESPVRRLFGWDRLVEFISSVTQRQLYRSADPLAAAVVQIQRDGDQQDWHFDISEYTILLHSQAPESGGTLHYVVRSRDQMLQDSDMLSRIAAGDPTITIREVPFSAGKLVLHAGNVSMHRVTPTAGPIARVNATLTYFTSPGAKVNEYARRLHFGRNE